MDIKINIPKDNNSHISNLAFVKALLINSTIEKLDINYNEKEELKNKILEYLKNTWKQLQRELESHKKGEFVYEKQNNNCYIF